MALHRRIHSPFHTSAASSLLNGTTWHVSIDGRPFRLDTANQAFQQGMQSIAALREQADNSVKPGESSINREDLWRDSSTSWHKGAGQRYRDKEDSDPDRFWSSKGVDVWTKDELKLLNGTLKILDITNLAPQMVQAGDFLFVSDGATLKRYNGNTSITITGGGGTILSMATNGLKVWVTTTTATYQVANANTDTTLTAFIGTGDANFNNIAFARGRLVLTRDQNIFEYRSNAAASLNPSEGNTNQRWTAVAEGNAAIFAAATTGNRSQIHKLTPPTDSPSGDLGVPVPAAPALPTGEIINALYGYLGQIVIGTNKGIRVAEEDGNANLVIGPLIKLPAPVKAFTGEGSFVWFTWSNFDGASTGLGRLDLSQLTDTGVYAYASDLMTVNNSGDVTAVASYNGKRYFCVSGLGMFAEVTSLTPTGWLQTGLIRYGIIDPKAAQYVELRHRKLSGIVSVDLSTDEGNFINLGESALEGTVSPTVSFDAKDSAGSNFELRVNLSRSSAFTGTPIIQAIQLRSAVMPTTGETFLVPLILTDNDVKFPTRQPLEDFEALVALKRYKRSVPYVELTKSFPRVIVQDYQFERSHPTKDGVWWNGTMILKLMAPAA